MAPTPPLLPNGNRAKERIHTYGPPKIGKTHQLFRIAKWHQDLGSDAVFYGLNSDTSWEVLHSNPEFCDLTNLRYEDCNYLQDYYNHVRKFHELLRPQDWLCLDLADHMWTASQDEYARAKTKNEKGAKFEDIGDLWEVSDSAETGKYPIEGWDWGMPNARYRTLANNYILRGAGHRFIISGQKKMQEPTAKMKEKEDETTKKRREMFEHIGIEPTGQKEDPFRYHTILHLDSNGEKKQKMSTAGERWGTRRWWGKAVGKGEVRTVRDEPFEDFFVDYLVKTAGWSMDD